MTDCLKEEELLQLEQFAHVLIEAVQILFKY